MKELIHELRWKLVEMDAAARMFAELDRWSTRLTWVAVAATVAFVFAPWALRRL